MNDAFADLGSVVTVAVAFDHHSLVLTETAATICERTGKSLCLVHVIEPWVEVPVSRSFGAKDPLWDVTHAVERDAHDKAIARMDELAATVQDRVDVTKRLVAGKPVAQIMQVALEQQSCLVLVGASYSNLRFLPRGLSTAMSLMAHLPMPVLVMDARHQESPIAPVPARTRILIADDLSPNCSFAVQFTLGLAAALRYVDVRHVHINSVTLGSLTAGLDIAAASGHTLVDPAGAAARIYDALIDDLHVQLAERADAQREYVEAAEGAYLAEVKAGDISNQLEDLTTTFAPHLMVFGRHRTFHTHPFFVGRVPLRGMLMHRRPVLVVPNQESV